MTKRTAPFWTTSTLGLAVVVACGAARAEGLVVPKAEPAAGAEVAAVPSAPANWGDYNARPLTLSKGMFGIHGDLVSNISHSTTFAPAGGGKPVWITPNVFYGVTDQLSVGIAENPQAEFLPTGGGLCLGSSSYCGKVFNYLGPTVLLSFARTSAMEIAGHAGLDFAFSPMQVGVRAGALMKFAVTGPVAIMADPTVSVGINRRDLGNKEVIYVPVRLGLQANPQINAGLVSGVNGPVDGFGDAFAIPIGVGVLATPNDKLDVGLNFTFTNLAGKHAPGVGAADGRSIALTVNYRT